MKVLAIPTKPIEGMKPGTSGLRKKTKIFQSNNYLENFVQSVFYSLPINELKGSTLVVSGDGRYYNNEAIQIIIKIAAANGIKRVWVGQYGLLSTPAVSAVIRERENGVAYGGLILTASHNPAGPDEDFGIKYNIQNGGPALESLTDKIYQESKNISEIKIAQFPDVDITKIGINDISSEFQVEVIDTTEDYVKCQKNIFDFSIIRQFVKREDFKFIYDAMYGVAGPYAKRIFVEELGLSDKCLYNCDPDPCFGGIHPDPNLVHAADFAKLFLNNTPDSTTPDFGACADGDADRNMILGKGVFVTPSDSVAIIAAYAERSIPYFRSGLKGIARSMPTSSSLDRVAKKNNLSVYEVPTGWKYFGNLMDAGKLSICGEESFGTGSDHIREKDGIWAVLAWLSILAFKNQNSTKLISVKEIVDDFWLEYGRNYYTRYDYEEVPQDRADAVFERLLGLDAPPFENLASTVPSCSELLKIFKLEKIDNFEYTDPVDKSVTKKQGIRYIFTDGSRLIWRLSGTGTTGATIRMYIDKYQSPTDSTTNMNCLSQKPEYALDSLIQLGLAFSDIVKLTGREKPSVIT
eukprot:GHVL01024836.1.p1 GENE.GHVL01024836.1~~GHVL01024836.1.p1  ORF type:complete len:578 (+),score=130.77 GHVL01024836.1:78-1811(+)